LNKISFFFRINVDNFENLFFILLLKSPKIIVLFIFVKIFLDIFLFKNKLSENKLKNPNPTIPSISIGKSILFSTFFIIVDIRKNELNIISSPFK
jgi:hypothetical protein